MSMYTQEHALHIDKLVKLVSYHGEEHAVVSHVSDDAADHGHQSGVMLLKGSVRSDMLNHILKQRVHFTLLRVYTHNNRHILPQVCTYKVFDREAPLTMESNNIYLYQGVR